ncbi:MAG: hypothetical protein K2W96_15220 [Gemmataceae bacterium]|nr:hypothetical protein [Gemmataceae bacterium]
MTPSEQEFMMLAADTEAMEMEAALLPDPIPDPGADFDLMDVWMVAAGMASPDLAHRVHAYAQDHPDSQAARTLAAGERYGDEPMETKRVPPRPWPRWPWLVGGVLAASVVMWLARPIPRALVEPEPRHDEPVQPNPGISPKTEMFVSLYPTGTRDSAIPDASKGRGPARFRIPPGSSLPHAMELRLPTRRTRAAVYFVGAGFDRLVKPSMKSEDALPWDLGGDGTISGICTIDLGRVSDTGFVFAVLFDKEAENSLVAESLGGFLPDGFATKMYEAARQPDPQAAVRALVEHVLAENEVARPFEVRLLAILSRDP